MKAWLKGLYHSFPVQLVFLHFRKYQILLLFWFILFSTVSGHFMKTFGADSLYLAPEYLGNVNSISYAIVGGAIGMFIMSWNITSFILFSRHFRFMAAATNPFLKFCINNSILPILFLLFYFFNAYHFLHTKELVGNTEILFFFGGFASGFIFIIGASLIYFFRADKTITERMMPVISEPKNYITHLGNVRHTYHDKPLITVHTYLETPYRLRAARDVSHYTDEYVEATFRGHHIAAILSVFAAFLFLIAIGFFLDNSFFQLPAAGSVTIFFSILIGVSGAVTYFLQSWSMPYLIGLIFLLNVFYQLDWIDPRNKAYGLNYWNKAERPAYTREHLSMLASPENVSADKLNMISVLEAWKKKQADTIQKPLLVLINTSGGGHRSATFTMGVLQALDSITHGEVMRRTFLINGASGGMIGAAYFRELYLRKINGENINLQDRNYISDISGDLLNPLFTSFFARDLIAPAQKFSVGPYQYIKDRGYSFEQGLNQNTRGFLNKQLKEYVADERNARIPMMFFNSVITRDSRKMIISTQPVRFMMRGQVDTTAIPQNDPDAVDFVSFFKEQDPYNLRMLTALRMNATFPVVLPNVWLPSDPVIDVMDAGLRDNYGQETSLRFISSFEDWIRENTSGVLIIQIRDRQAGGWETPYLSDDITDHVTKPFLLLQHNWFKMMEYSQNDMLDYYTTGKGIPVFKVSFQYQSGNAESKAALNFHLTKREARDIMYSIKTKNNQQNFIRVRELFASPEAH